MSLEVALSLKLVMQWSENEKKLESYEHACEDKDMLEKMSYPGFYFVLTEPEHVRRPVWD